MPEPAGSWEQVPWTLRMTLNSVHSTDFRHAALFYSGDDEFLRRTMPLIRSGLENGEPVLVMVPGRRLSLLRSELGDDGAEVEFADMTEVGANPARIIPAWREFVARSGRPGVRLRGIGEPIWADRSEPELSECHLHEALLNVAFAEGAALDLVCPYDRDALGAEVLEQAFRNHPTVVCEDGALRESDRYPGLHEATAPFRDPLPPPPAHAAERGFDSSTLMELRELVSKAAAEAGLGPARQEDLVLAVNELACNSVLHGGGRGTLRVWGEADAVVAEVSDGGRIEWPLAGREAPRPGQVGGHGLWLVNQLCDLLQLRSLATGSVARVRVRTA